MSVRSRGHHSRWAGALTTALVAPAGACSDPPAAPLAASRGPSAGVAVAAAPTLTWLASLGTGTVPITASAPGSVPSTGTAMVRQAGVKLLHISDSPFTAPSNLPFGMSAGVLADEGTLLHERRVRARGPPITVSPANSNPAVTRLVTATDAGQTTQVAIPVGASESPLTPAPTDPGVQLNPLTRGTTTVWVTASRKFFTRPQKFMTVIVSDPPTATSTLNGVTPLPVARGRAPVVP
jgi:hypothetical protein